MLVTGNGGGGHPAPWRWRGQAKEKQKFGNEGAAQCERCWGGDVVRFGLALPRGVGRRRCAAAADLHAARDA